MDKKERQEELPSFIISPFSVEFYDSIDPMLGFVQGLKVSEGQTLTYRTFRKRNLYSRF